MAADPVSRGAISAEGRRAESGDASGRARIAADPIRPSDLVGRAAPSRLALLRPTGVGLAVERWVTELRQKFLAEGWELKHGAELVGDWLAIGAG